MQPFRLLRTLIHRVARRVASLLPRSRRHRAFRALVDCDPAPDPRLVVKIAENREELEACFRLLHDTYVASGYMRPDPSGMRVTIYCSGAPPQGRSASGPSRVKCSKAVCGTGRSTVTGAITAC